MLLSTRLECVVVSRCYLCKDVIATMALNVYKSKEKHWFKAIIKHINVKIRQFFFSFPSENSYANWANWPQRLKKICLQCLPLSPIHTSHFYCARKTLYVKAKNNNNNKDAMCERGFWWIQNKWFENGVLWLFSTNVIFEALLGHSALTDFLLNQTQKLKTFVQCCILLA